MPGHSTWIVLARLVVTSSRSTWVPLKTVGNRRINRVRDADVIIVTSSRPSEMVGAGADQHAAAVAAGVAECRQGEVGADLGSVVEGEPERQQS